MKNHMKARMNAIGLTRYLPVDDPQSLLDIELPIPAAAGHDLLVEVKAVSVNPVDTEQRAPIAANREKQESPPRVLGWDVAGVVTATGPLVTLFRPGDAVYYAGSVGRPGGNAEFHLVDERIAGHKPSTLGFAEAAALPLTTITAWQGMFHRMGISRTGADKGKTLLIIGGAGGVGSICIQLARRVAKLNVIATASRPESAAWARARGAQHIVDHSRPLGPQMRALGLPEADFVFCANVSQRHFADFPDLLAPQGRICSVVDGPGPEDFMALKRKSITFSWEAMFTRPLFATPDMVAQHQLLEDTAALVDAGVLHSTVTENLGRINASNLRRAHTMLEQGHTLGKIVLEGF
jgi:NADPH2:quinone reductase